jgi:hypothetical protein
MKTRNAAIVTSIVLPAATAYLVRRQLHKDPARTLKNLASKVKDKAGEFNPVADLDLRLLLNALKQKSLSSVREIDEAISLIVQVYERVQDRYAMTPNNLHKIYVLPKLQALKTLREKY